MRVVRTILGMLLLTVGLPIMLVGGGLWTATQHRDSGGAFSGPLQEITTAGYAVLAPDLDGLLSHDVPLVRGGDTRVRITADTAAGPAFIGIAPADEAARYLAGVPYTRVDGVDLGTGTLPLRTTAVAGFTGPANLPVRQSFWLRSGTGALDWTPAELRDNQLAMIIMAPNARPGLTVRATAEVRPGWLDPAAWGLLAIGTVLIALGMATLAWPGRRRDVVYVVDPSQVPALAARLRAPLALGAGPEPARPASLAEVPPAPAWPVTPPALPSLAWPPLPRDGQAGSAALDARGIGYALGGSDAVAAPDRVGSQPIALEPVRSAATGEPASGAGVVAGGPPRPVTAGDVPVPEAGDAPAPSVVGGGSVPAAHADAAAGSVVGGGSAPFASADAASRSAVGDGAVAEVGDGSGAAWVGDGPVPGAVVTAGAPVPSVVPDGPRPAQDAAGDAALPAVVAGSSLPRASVNGGDMRASVNGGDTRASVDGGDTRASVDGGDTRRPEPTRAEPVPVTRAATGDVPAARTAPAAATTGGQGLTAVPGAPPARSRRRKTAGGLPIGDAPPAETLVKTTRPARTRSAGKPAATKAAEPVDDAVKPAG